MITILGISMFQINIGRGRGGGGGGREEGGGQEGEEEGGKEGGEKEEEKKEKKKKKKRPIFQRIKRFLSGDHLASLFHQPPYKIIEPTLNSEKGLNNFIISQYIWTFKTKQDNQIKGTVLMIIPSSPYPSSRHCQTLSLDQTSPAPQLPNPDD